MAEGDEAPPAKPAAEATAPAAETKAPPKKRAPKKETSEKPAAAPAEAASTTPAAAAPASTPAAPKAPAGEAKRPPRAAPHRPAPAASTAAKPRPEKPARVHHGTVVDVSGLVLGRAASLLAKRLLNGEQIVVVNADLSVVTGDRAMVLETYRANRARGSKRTGPHFPRYPDRIFRRTVRGMLPHLKTRGKEALDRLEVFIGVPPELKGHAVQSLEPAKVRPALRRPLTLGEISRLLGARL